MIYFLIRSNSALTNVIAYSWQSMLFFVCFKPPLFLPIPLLWTFYFSLWFFCYFHYYYHLNISYCNVYFYKYHHYAQSFLFIFKRERTSLMLLYLVSSPTCYFYANKVSLIWKHVDSDDRLRTKLRRRRWFQLCHCEHTIYIHTKIMSM